MTQNACESSLELINHMHIINPRACSATVARLVCNEKVSGSNPDKSIPSPIYTASSAPKKTHGSLSETALSLTYPPLQRSLAWAPACAVTLRARDRAPRPLVAFKFIREYLLMKKINISSVGEWQTTSKRPQWRIQYK